LLGHSPDLYSLYPEPDKAISAARPCGDPPIGRRTSDSLSCLH
jgi:hypothetical protein